MTEQNSSEEIDLGYLFKKANDFFRKVARGLFLIIDFFLKYIIIVIVLLIIGFGIGFYKDLNTIKTYNNEVIVIPNFESVDYFYDKVDAINSKISSGDTLYLQKVLDTNFRKLKNIKLEPIVDIYNFVSKSYRNLDVLKLIAEKQDFSEYIEDLSTSKYYKYHRMNISVTGKDSSEKMVNDLLTFLNKNEHFRNYQEVYIQNNKLDIKEHYLMIAQIDSLLKANSNLNSGAANVSINNSSDIFNLIDRKKQLIQDLLQLQTEEIDYAVTIKEVSADYNLKTERFLSLSNKVKYPLLLIFLFSMVFFIIYIFKNLKSYSKSNSLGIGKN